jgi:hypothetical protein
MMGVGFAAPGVLSPIRQLLLSTQRMEGLRELPALRKISNETRLYRLSELLSGWELSGTTHQSGRCFGARFSAKV